MATMPAFLANVFQETPKALLFMVPPKVGCVKIKLSISFPAMGCQKLIEVDDGYRLHVFYEKCPAADVAADAL